MSDAALGALLEKTIIPIVQKSASRTKGKEGTRRDLEQYPGQIFRFDWKAHLKVLSTMHNQGQFLNGKKDKLSDTEIKRHLKVIFENFKTIEEGKVVGYKKTLKSQQDGKPVTVTVTKDRFNDLKNEANKSKNYWTMVCRNYTKVQEFTTPGKSGTTHNLNRKLNELDNKISGTNHDIKKDSGRFDFQQEVGHGFGKGMASAGYAAGRATGKLQKMAGSNRIIKDVIEKDAIKSKLQTINKKFGVDLDHVFKLADNDFAKDYFLVLTSQDKDTNRLEGFEEKTLLADLQKLFEEIVLEVKASPSLRNSIEEQIFSYFEAHKKLKTSGKKSRKKFKSNSSAYKNIKVKQKSLLPIITGGVQLQLSQIKKKRNRSRNPKAVSPLGILMLLNKRLPQKVQQNMGQPGLANRTGRFAASVKAVNIQESKSGLPMIDYTYQKNPYEVFETSKGQRPWSSLERDPRTLIDESVRELAAEMALGKFTTRRV